MFKFWDHTSLVVEDLDMSLAFYGEIFGYKTLFIERDMTREIRSMTGLDHIVCDLAQMSHPLSNQRLELIAFRDHNCLSPSIPIAIGMGHIGFEVEDIDEALTQVTKAGATPIGVITDFPECRSTYCRAPGGSFFELSEMKGALWD